MPEKKCCLSIVVCWFLIVQISLSSYHILPLMSARPYVCINENFSAKKRLEKFQMTFTHTLSLRRLKLTDLFSQRNWKTQFWRSGSCWNQLLDSAERKTLDSSWLKLIQLKSFFIQLKQILDSSWFNICFQLKGSSVKKTFHR